MTLPPVSLDASEGVAQDRRPMQVVLFHAFKQPDDMAQQMIELAVRSVAVHYPDASIILLTNTFGSQLEWPAELRVATLDIDLSRLMFERIRCYAEVVQQATAAATLVFLDTDMLVMRRFDELLDPRSDLSVTVRNWKRETAPNGIHVPVNGGLYVVNTDRHARVADFFSRFVANYEALPKEHQAWDGDQIAIAELLDAPTERLRRPVFLRRGELTVCFAPVRIFNNTPRPLALRLGLYRIGARILHFKGKRKTQMLRYAKRFLPASAHQGK